MLGLENNKDLYSKINTKSNMLSEVGETLSGQIQPLDVVPTSSGNIQELIQIKEIEGGTMYLEKIELPLNFEDKQCTGVVLKDQTMFKRMEEERNKQVYQNMLLCGISHELRTPLNSIININNSILIDLSKGKTPSAADLGDLCSRSLHSSQTLFHLVNGILSLSEIKAAQFEPHNKAVPIRSILKYCANTYQTQIEDRGVQLIIENNIPENTLKLDETQFKSVLIILLGNAAKFTYEGIIRIVMYIGKHSHKKKVLSKKSIVCEVQDTGIGIKKRDIKGLFKMFGQNDHEIINMGKRHGKFHYILYRNGNWSNNM